MMQNTKRGMRPFTRIAHALLIVLKLHAAAKQIVNDLRRGTDHHFHRQRVVFIVPRLHGIHVIAGIVLLIFQRRDTALRQVGIAVFQVLFGDHTNLQMLRQLQSAKQPCSPCAYNEYIRFLLHGHFT